MTSGIIDESVIADAFAQSGANQILIFQGLGFWKGDLAEMRGDSPRRPVAEPGMTSPDTSEAVRRMVMILRMKAALKQLPPQEHEALRLHYNEALPLEEIAERLGVKTDQAAAVIDRALQHVNEIYIDSLDGHAES